MGFPFKVRRLCFSFKVRKLGFPYKSSFLIRVEKLVRALGPPNPLLMQNRNGKTPRNCAIKKNIPYFVPIVKSDPQYVV